MARSERRREPDPYDADDHDDDHRPRGRRRGYVEHRGTMILVFGILALVAFGPVFGPLAWIMGSNDLKEIRAGRMDPEGESQTQIGMILGIVGTILSIVLVLFCTCGLSIVGLAALEDPAPR